jgi:hypothetical protein
MHSVNEFVKFRERLLELISETVDSGEAQDYGRTDVPNSTTRHRLDFIFELTCADLNSEGLYIVLRHLGCGKPTHGQWESVLETDHSNLTHPYGHDIDYFEIDDTYTYSNCPCRKHEKLTKHRIVRDVVYPKAFLNRRGNLVVKALEYVADAMNIAGKKAPRAAIREKLLRAILLINDAILTESIDDHVRRITARQ